MASIKVLVRANESHPAYVRHEVDFDVVNLMDNDLREEIHDNFEPTGEQPKDAQDFTDVYCRLHQERFGKPFIVN